MHVSFSVVTENVEPAHEFSNLSPTLSHEINKKWDNETEEGYVK